MDRRLEMSAAGYVGGQRHLDVRALPILDTGDGVMRQRYGNNGLLLAALLLCDKLPVLCVLACRHLHADDVLFGAVTDAALAVVTVIASWPFLDWAALSGVLCAALLTNEDGPGPGHVRREP